MTRPVVVYASVWVSWRVTDNVFHAASRRWFAQQAAVEGQLVAPVLMLAEVVGATSRRTSQPDLASRTLKGLLRLPGLRLVPLDRRLGREAAELAASASLRGADAVYAALASHLSIPLITWDLELRQRVGNSVEVVQPSEV